MEVGKNRLNAGTYTAEAGATEPVNGAQEPNASAQLDL